MSRLKLLSCTQALLICNMCANVNCSENYIHKILFLFKIELLQKRKQKAYLTVWGRYIARPLGEGAFSASGPSVFAKRRLYFNVREFGLSGLYLERLLDF